MKAMGTRIARGMGLGLAGLAGSARAQGIWEAAGGSWESAASGSGALGWSVGLLLAGALGLAWLSIRLERSNRRLGEALRKVQEQEQILGAEKDKLAIARQAGKMGHWEWRLSEGKLEWSDEVYGIFGVEKGVFEPTRKAILELVAEEDRKNLDAALGKALGSERGEYEVEHRIERPDGETRWAVEVGRVVSGRGGLPEKIVGTIRDVTAERMAQERIEQQKRELWALANYDQLTGLANRRMIEERLSQALREHGRTGKQVGALFIDLDRFSRINEALGMEAGDALLRLVAARLGDRLRETDALARLGGDQFLAVLVGIDDERAAASAAKAIGDLLGDPFELGGEEFSLTASIGIALGPKDGGDAQRLSQAAEAAMDRVKKDGGESFGFYREDMTRAVEDRLRMEGKMREALRKGHFELRVQPQVSLDEGDTGRIVGAEALIRWNDPEEGMVNPADFIPLAEETGLIGPIGEWVFKEACALSKSWVEEGIAPEGFRLSVNVSARQLMRGDFARMARESGADGLVVELTESAAMERSAQETIEELERMGIEISIDDFGTGYSSLSRLRDLPISEIKIDRSFVEGVGDGGDAICQAVMALARSMGIRVVAEGIERESQERFLRGIECHAGQGYRYARPLEPRAFEELLRAGGRIAIG